MSKHMKQSKNVVGKPRASARTSLPISSKSVGISKQNKLNNRPKFDPLLGPYAPSAVSISGNRGIKFSGNMLGKHLMVSAQVPLCFIGNDAFFNGFAVATGAGTSAPAAVMLLNPQQLRSSQKDAADPPTGVNGRWLSPQLALIALAFDRYRVRKFGLCYEPQAATDVADRLVLAYAEDPSHPVLSGIVGGSFSSVPTQTDLLITPDSVAFAPWKQWEIDLPVENTEGEYFMTGGSSVADTNRFSQHGVIACRATSVTAAPIVYGILYAKVVYEFIDPTPVVQSVAPVPLQVNSRTSEEKKERFVDADLPVDVSPPRYEGAPSNTPCGVRVVVKEPVTLKRTGWL
jgi:hypothetical protein